MRPLVRGALLAEDTDSHIKGLAADLEEARRLMDQSGSAERVRQQVDGLIAARRDQAVLDARDAADALAMLAEHVLAADEIQRRTAELLVGSGEALDQLVEQTRAGEAAERRRHYVVVALMVLTLAASTLAILVSI